MILVKKNYRKIPPRIHATLKTLQDKEIVVACIKTFSASDLQAGCLAHLGVTLDEDGLHLPEGTLPEPNGKYSYYNRYGKEIIRKDLPKETRYTPVETPNWGDEANGTHTVYLPYEKFPRDYEAPALAIIQMDSPDTNPNLATYAIRFRLNEIMDRTSVDFQNRLLEGLNILQEQLGSCGVQGADVPLSEYIKTLNVTWEILPPGTAEEAVERLYRGRNPSEKERGVIHDRYRFLKELDPQNMVYGTSGFQRYFGAMIRPDLVVFENVEYGNAIYVMFDSWETLSGLSRIELLSGRFGDAFERVVHGPQWKEKVKVIIERRLTSPTS